MRISSVLYPAILSAMALGGCQAPDEVASAESGLDSTGDKGKPEPPMLGAHGAKDAHTARSGGGGSPDLTLHGGNVMSSVAIQPIFWGSSWTTPADKISGLEQFYRGLANSSYASTNVEYIGVNGTQVTDSAITYSPEITDLSAAPRSAPKTSAVLAEVCKEIKNPVANGYYPVYTDTRRGGASYCAWHSWGTCGSVPVQFGFFFNLDGDSGCDPQDTASGRSEGLSALANVTGHEFSEMVTDPRGNGWLDSSGAENGDKCAWAFPANASYTITLNDSSTWKVQGNWSNNAYNAGTGQPNTSGQKGCLFN